MDKKILDESLIKEIKYISHEYAWMEGSIIVNTTIGKIFLEIYYSNDLLGDYQYSFAMFVEQSKSDTDTSLKTLILLRQYFYDMKETGIIRNIENNETEEDYLLSIIIDLINDPNAKIEYKGVNDKNRKREWRYIRFEIDNGNETISIITTFGILVISNKQDIYQGTKYKFNYNLEDGKTNNIEGTVFGYSDLLLKGKKELSIIYEKISSQGILQVSEEEKNNIKIWEYNDNDDSIDYLTGKDQAYTNIKVVKWFNKGDNDE